MFTKIEIENIGPISDSIVIDFTINKRDKLNSKSYVELPGNICVSKIIGIIAGNSYGKTTILDTLNKIGSFLNLTNMKLAFNSFYTDENMVNDDMIKKILYDDFKEKVVSNRLPILNRKQNNPTASITLEMYIDSHDKYAGFYKYCIKYDKNFLVDGLIEESLSFKEKYNSKKEKQIFKISGNTESEIGYKLAYKKNILEEFKINSKEKDKFIEKINYYETFSRRYLQESSTLSAENYIFSEDYIIDMVNQDKKIVMAFAKMADYGINNLIVDEKDLQNIKLYFDYDNYKIRYNEVSTATKKLCAIAGNYVKSNTHGGVFLIDELDNSLNREIIRFITSLYINNITNNTSQLIFTTNTPEILNELRRDQIFILTKSSDNVVKVTKFIDYIDEKTKKRVRKDYSFSKAYRNNIINNFPNELSIRTLNDLIK